MDCPESSRCFKCANRQQRLCLAAPTPVGATLLRVGQPVRVCNAYIGPQGEVIAVESNRSLGIRL